MESIAAKSLISTAAAALAVAVAAGVPTDAAHFTFITSPIWFYDYVAIATVFVNKIHTQWNAEYICFRFKFNVNAISLPCVKIVWNATNARSRGENKKKHTHKNRSANRRVKDCNEKSSLNGNENENEMYDRVEE